MVVVDSSAWIEIATKSALGARLRQYVPRQSECIVPTIVQYEMAKWLSREVTRGRRNRFLAYLDQCLVAELTTDLAIRAAYLAPVIRLFTADAIIYATTVEFGATLLTCDAHFKDLPQVIYVAKS